jgi:glycosyltransferase involved in cell wall biosynthesis
MSKNTTTPSKGRAPSVLMLSNTTELGGVERVVCTLHKELEARGWQVRSIFPETQNSAKQLNWCREQGMNAEAHPAVMPLMHGGTPAYIRETVRFYRQNRADSVILHYGDNYVGLKDLLALRLAGCRRIIAAVHHPVPYEEGMERRKTMMRRAAALSDRVVVATQQSWDTIRSANVPATRLTRIPYGVPAPAVLPTREDARARFGLTGENFIIGSLCRLDPHKGIDLLLRAAALASRRTQEPPLVLIAGSGPERERLEEMANALPGLRFRFLGRIADEDVPYFYAACDLFALPSRMEGFGLVYVEAAFHGVPSIGSNVGGIPDAIEDGETGWLIPVDDVDALTKQIETLVHPRGRDLLLKAGTAGRARALSSFSTAGMGEAYEALLLGKPVSQNSAAHFRPEAA